MSHRIDVDSSTREHALNENRARARHPGDARAPKASAPAMICGCCRVSTVSDPLRRELRNVRSLTKSARDYARHATRGRRGHEPRATGRGARLECPFGAEILYLNICFLSPLVRWREG